MVATEIFEILDKILSEMKKKTAALSTDDRDRQCKLSVSSD